MYRKAEDRDIADLVELTLAFCRETFISTLAEVSVEKITEIYLSYIVDEKGICWVATENDKVVGFIIGHIGQLSFTTDKTAYVLCWWAEKTKHFFERSQNLLSVFEDDAVEQGATGVLVASLGSATVERVYTKNDYRPFETLYIKDLR